MLDRIATNDLSVLLEQNIQSKLVENVTPKMLDHAETSIRTYMESCGINFEGHALPMSLRPLVMSDAAVAATAKDLQLVRRAINRIIAQIRLDIAGETDTILSRFFSGYSKWFGLIAAEKRQLPDVMLMRFDTAFDAAKGWQAMEPNTACPGGVIHCAYLRAAWQSSGLGSDLVSDIPIVERAIDDPSGFVGFLDSTINSPDDNCHAVICNFNGTYTNELESLVRRARADQKAGRHNLTISIADICELEVIGDEIHLHGRRVDLIYNKLDPLEIDPNAPEIKAWIAASQSSKCLFLNSFGAMYIGEAKSMFAALADPAIAKHAKLTPHEVAAVARVVLPTYRVRDLTAGRFKEAVSERAAWVLKEDATTRGIGVELGDAHDAGRWNTLLKDYFPRNGVIQRAVATPRRSMPGNTGEEFFGADWFFFGDEFSGCVSRAHKSKVFNVGNGGCEVPVIVVRDTPDVKVSKC